MRAQVSSASLLTGTKLVGLEMFRTRRRLIWSMKATT
jgi:hypothetical protein